MMRALLKTVWHLLALAGLAALAAGAWLWSAGIETRTPPGAIETAVARLTRSAMIPSSARSRRNPEPATAENLRGALEHWADHCASCHGNDGAGNTEMGRGLYPPAPDMRLPATQNLTDGELFYLIENGVKLTGMPAWGTGTPEGEQATWHLVHFIRRLPTLSEAELAAMEELNPRSPAEWRQQEEERRFLEGQEPAPEAAPHQHKGEPQ
jgi:mono/diheme cytochrome c family protein